MNNQHALSRNKKLIALFLALCVVALGVGAALLLLPKVFAKNGSVSTQVKAKSLFSFTGTPGWRQGPSNETSMALFGAERKDSTSSCFTSMEYKTGNIDAGAALEKQQADLQATGNVVKRIKTTTATLSTNSGKKQYQLQQYDIASKGEKLMGGLALGYLQLKDGYVKIDSHCNTAEELETTIPALQAYRLNK